MSAAAKSLVVWGVYLVLMGGGLLLFPNVLMRLFGLAESREIYPRIVGILFLILSYYMFRAARAELRPFFRWTVHARAPIVFVIALFVILKMAQPTVLLFGLFDFLGAVYTALALRSEAPLQDGRR